MNGKNALALSTLKVFADVLFIGRVCFTTVTLYFDHLGDTPLCLLAALCRAIID